MRWPPQRLSILIYHRVLAAPDPLLPDLPDARAFARQMRWLRRCFRVLPLHEAVHRLREGRLPPRAAAITFDDGYADNAEVALPVLRQLGLPACFFVASGYLDGGQMWNDSVIEHVRHASGPWLDLDALGLGRHAIDGWRQKAHTIDLLLQRLKYLPQAQRQALADLLSPPAPSGLMMRSAQLRLLHGAGMEIGAHTVSHPILATLSDAQASAEIGASKSALEAIIDAPVRCFAYPNGKPERDYDARHTAMVAAHGYSAAVATRPAAAGPDSDPFQLPRFTPWEADPLRFALRLAQSRWSWPA